MEDKDLDLLQNHLGYHFRDGSFLVQAITHTTFAYESRLDHIKDNQRLEFLGDSVLGMVVAEYLYNESFDFSEGEMTRRRALLVNQTNLAQKALKLNLSEFVLLGKGEKKLNGNTNAKNLAGALEAIIGAIYLDGGLEAARKFIIEKITVS